MPSKFQIIQAFSLFKDIANAMDQLQINEQDSIRFKDKTFQIRRTK